MTLRSGTGRHGTVYRYYSCSTAHRVGDHACTGRSIGESLLDGVVVDHLSDVLFRPEILSGWLEDVIAEEERVRSEGPRTIESLLA